jgi:hypothetical protein
MTSCFNDPKLILCLEPEVACIGWLKSLQQARNPPRIVDQKTTIMMYDIGGGTADVSIHIVCDRPKGTGLDARRVHTWQLSEILSPAGESCGSTAVDEIFKIFVKDLFQKCTGGPQAHADFARSREMSALMDQFEQVKEGFTGNEDDYYTDINFCDAISAIRKANPSLADAQRVAERWNASCAPEDSRRLRAAGGPPPGASRRACDYQCCGAPCFLRPSHDPLTQR